LKEKIEALGKEIAGLAKRQGELARERDRLIEEGEAELARLKRENPVSETKQIQEISRVLSSSYAWDPNARAIRQLKSQVEALKILQGGKASK
jgi:hypothetical protein